MIKRIALGWMVAMLSAVAWALPTTQQVEQAVQRGDYAQAETMMKEVVGARGDSARAHYVYAEILAHNGNFAQASQEASRARQIDPAIKFTEPAKFSAFQQLLERQQQPQGAKPQARRSEAAAPTSAPPAPAAGGLPSWVWIAGLAALGFGLWKVMSRRSAVGAAAGPAFGANQPMAAQAYGQAPMAGGNFGAPMAGGGYAPGMQMPSAGGGMMRTGAAVAGGLAAGVLLDQMMHRGGNDANAATGAADSSNFDASQSAGASADLENRAVDFGTGNDWDSGSVDVGGGSSDDGWS